MNRPWMIRAEQRLERLERVNLELRLVVEALKNQIEALQADEPVKRGPGRPKKEESVAA